MIITARISEERKERIDQLELDGFRDDKVIRVLYFLAERAEELEALIPSAIDMADLRERRRVFGLVDELFANATTAVWEGEIR